MSMRELNCCCGRSTCAFLTHNYTVLEDLERDVHEAGKAGQALLERHQNYIVESEKQLQNVFHAMERLVEDKEAFERSNSEFVKENRRLLDQLEELNSALTDSDLHISSLKTTLESSKHEMERLSSLGYKATQLECELTILEAERAKLDAQLAASQDEKLSAMKRWRKAELTINRLEGQIESIEKEASDERDRHTEVLSRVERQEALRLQLSTESCPKLNIGPRFTAVQNGAVTHFVRDILQDNSNLQMGIVELREMLSASNSQVSELRSKLELHGPPIEEQSQCDSLDRDVQNDHPLPLALDAAPELHVHHYYHQRRLLTRKTNRRRQVPAGTRPSRSLGLAPQQSKAIKDNGNAGVVSAVALSNTIATAPTPGHRSRWSMHSTATESSYAPSSLSASPRHSSIFDSLEKASDSTPESSVPGSPLLSVAPFKPSDFKELSEQLSPLSTLPSARNRRHVYLGDNAIPEEHEPNEDLGAIQDISRCHEASAAPPPPLRRIVSRDSLLSISGMDIHTSAPSANLPINKPTTLLGPASPTSYSAATVTSAIAIPSRAATSATVGSELARSCLSQNWQSSMPRNTTTEPDRKAGGWMFSKWSGAPVSTMDKPTRTINSENSESKIDKARSPLHRSAGINQPGLILGILKPHQAQSDVRPRVVDTALLKESLDML